MRKVRKPRFEDAEHIHYVRDVGCFELQARFSSVYANSHVQHKPRRAADLSRTGQRQYPAFSTHEFCDVTRLQARSRPNAGWTVMHQDSLRQAMTAMTAGCDLYSDSESSRSPDMQGPRKPKRIALAPTLRFMRSYNWSYKSPNIGYNYSSPTYKYPRTSK